jgi:transcriptional regulator with XRE-family HTH domain
MEARSLPEAIKLIMKQRGCSQNQLGRDLRKGQSWVSDVINGKRAVEFAKVIKILARVGWEVRISPKPEDDDPVKRRAFVTSVASVFVPSATVGPYHDPAYLRELTRRQVMSRREHGGGAIAAAAIRHLRRIEPLIANRDRALQEAASHLAVETVWTLNDVRRFDAAENVGRIALELARRSDNTDAQSQAHSVLAAINIYRGEADRAVMYARRGTRLGGVPDAQQAWMRLHLGWSLASVPGQRRTSREVIEGVRELLGDDYLHRQSRLDAAHMAGDLGLALTDLGVYAEAQTLLGNAVTRLGHSWPTVQAILLANQITAALRAAQPSFAAERMLALARVAPLVNSPRVDASVRQILRLSSRWNAIPEAEAARAQLRVVLSPDR